MVQSIVEAGFCVCVLGMAWRREVVIVKVRVILQRMSVDVQYVLLAIGGVLT